MRNEECWNIKIAFFFVVMRLVYDTSIESKAKEKYAFALKSVFLSIREICIRICWYMSHANLLCTSYRVEI